MAGKVGKQFASRLSVEVASLRSQWFEIEGLHVKPSPDKWSKIEILGHLSDSARYQLLRLSGISAATDVYTCPTYAQNDLVTLMQYQAMSADGVLQLWISLNQLIMHAWSHTEDGLWEKPCVFGVENLSFSAVAEDYISHMAHHKQQILDDVVTKSNVETISVSSAINVLKLLNDNGASKEFVLMSHIGDLEIEYYKPNGVDRQNPHLKDEIYIIISGQGHILKGDQKYPFGPQDVIYVKAGEEHRFVEFSEDFATWVMFYGQGNEAKH